MLSEKDIVEAVTDERRTTGLGGRWYGVFPAIVTDIRDPDHLGRVKISLPWAPDTSNSGYEAWARIATLMAGNNRGSWFVPDPGDEVLVSFEHGDPRRPYVVGALWNGVDKPPELMDGAGQNTKKVLRSRNGVKITMSDVNGSESLTVETPAGQTITLHDGPASVQIADANGNSVRLDSSGVSVVASAKVTIQATSVNVTTTQLTVNASMSKFSGVVQADTVISNSVVSASYTPGAGNVW